MDDSTVLASFRLRDVRDLLRVALRELDRAQATCDYATAAQVNELALRLQAELARRAQGLNRAHGGGA